MGHLASRCAVSDARTVRPGHAVTYHGDPAPALRPRRPDPATVLRELAAAVSARAEERLRAAVMTVPGPQQWQSRGAGLALQDVAQALQDLADRL